MVQGKSIIKQCVTEMKWWIKYRRIIVESKKIGNNYCVLLGTPEHGNLGDHAITIATYQFLKDMDVSANLLEISGQMLRTKRHVRMFEKVIKDKTILLNGGGYLGTLWMCEENMVRDVISTYADNRIIILPQTLYFESSIFGEKVKKDSVKIYDSHSNLWLCTREEQSYLLAKEIFQNVHLLLVPDMALYLKHVESKKKKKGILLCLRSDKERVLNENDWKTLNKIMLKYIKPSHISYSDTVVDYQIKKEDREDEVYKKIEEFSQRKLVITDRLHGMVLAAIAGTPCITFSNCNYKVKGVYNWIRNNQYIVFVESIDQLEKEIDNLMKIEKVQYNNKLILENYEGLKKLIADR